MHTHYPMICVTEFLGPSHLPEKAKLGALTGPYCEMFIMVGHIPSAIRISGSGVEFGGLNRVPLGVPGLTYICRNVDTARYRLCGQP